MQSYRITLSSNFDKSIIEAQWRELESKAKARFFISWTWIAAWLESFNPQARLLTITFNDHIVGLCFCVFQKEHRHKIISSNCLYLNQTGIADEDQVWSEFNGFLIDSEHESQALKACFDYLNSDINSTSNIKGDPATKIKWDEIITGVISEERNTLYTQQSQLIPYIRWQAQGYKIDFAAIRDQGKNYLESVSRNTRYQINKTRKKCEQDSPINLVKAQSLEQALNYLDELAPLHIQRWNHSAEGSGFSNPKFVLFHQNLIKQAWAAGQVELIKVSNSNGLLCYFYNFIYAGTVYFYLSAISYDNNDKKLQPGLLSHCLCIQHYLDQGLNAYDFLGGTARYKKSLSNTQYDLMVLSLQKTTAKLLLERAARFMKNLGRNKD